MIGELAFYMTLMYESQLAIYDLRKQRHKTIRGECP